MEIYNFIVIIFSCKYGSLMTFCIEAFVDLSEFV